MMVFNMPQIKVEITKVETGNFTMSLLCRQANSKFFDRLFNRYKWDRFEKQYNIVIVSCESPWEKIPGTIGPILKEIYEDKFGIEHITEYWLPGDINISNRIKAYVKEFIEIILKDAKSTHTTEGSTESYGICEHQPG